MGIEISNCREAGIYIEPLGDKAAENNKFELLDIHDCGVGFRFNARDNHLKHSYLYHNVGDGIIIEAGAGSSQIMSCGIYGNGGNGVNIRGIKAPPETWHCQIINCQIDYNKKHGIVITDDVKFMNIIENRIWKNSQEAARTYDGINVTRPAGGWSSHIEILGNNIYEDRRFGIYFDLDPNAEPSLVAINFCREDYRLFGPVYDLGDDPGPGRRTRLLLEKGDSLNPSYSFRALPTIGFLATSTPFEVKAALDGALKMAIGTVEAKFDVRLRPMADNAKDLGSPTLRWKQASFSDIISIRRDAGDYGGNFANCTRPPGREGALLVAEDTNLVAPGRRLYVYSGGAWRYVILSG